ncbi:hypothetical protein DFH94DRAFT_618626, partial [Russula ochroleuca]
KKEGYNTFGPWEGPTSTQKVKSAQKEAWAEALNAPNRDEYIQRIKEADPKTYIVWNENITKYADKTWPTPKEDFTPEYTEFFRVPQEMKDWVNTELPKKNRPKCLVIWGPSRTGKSSWARSLGHHTYLNNSWDITQIDETSNYIVVDDMPFSDPHHFKNWQPFLGSQLQFTVTDKYTRKKPIRWGKPCIYLNNQDPLEANLPDWQKQWLQANCIFVNLDHRLYSPEAMLPPLFAPRPI